MTFGPLRPLRPFYDGVLVDQIMQACHWKTHISKFLPKRPYLVRQRQQYVSGTSGGGTQVLDISPQTSHPRKERKVGGHIRYSQVFRSLIPGSRYRFTFQDVTGKVILYF